MDLLNALRSLPVEESASLLLGRVLVREIDGMRLSGKIVETEAYHQSDPASHTFRGQTPRNAAMFGPAGRAYVYFTYGMHHCFNVTAGQEAEGAAVLIRALEPLEGLDIMQQNRFRRGDTSSKTGVLFNLCSGPAKLCQALAIDKALYGHDLSKPPLYLEGSKAILTNQVVKTTRIGIKESTEAPLRFYIKDSPFISRR